MCLPHAMFSCDVCVDPRYTSVIRLCFLHVNKVSEFDIPSAEYYAYGMASTPSLPAIELKNVTKFYGKSRGVENISLSIRQGEVFGFLGPNGAGKSTTINIILDLLRADHGTIQVLGADARQHPVGVHKKIGFLSGDMTTDPSLTGAQYLKFAAHLHGGVSEQKVKTLVKRLQCETGKKIKHLSRGNRQKIGLIAALMHDPDVLILDEPTSGLDPLIQDEFYAIIREHKERGKTTFMSSHVLSEVQASCDRVGFIREGTLIHVNSLDKLMEQASRHVLAVYRETVPKSRFNTLDGVSHLKIQGNRCNFTFRGDYNELVRVLGTKPMTDLQISEPSLDELFMEYYRGEENEEALDV